jgi:hypothetical protein
MDLVEKYIATANVKTMTDEELLSFWQDQKRRNFNKMSGKLFVAFIDEIKRRHLTNRL